MIYSYSINNDTLNAAVVFEKLKNEIEASNISVSLDYISSNDDTLNIVFTAVISANEKITLDALIAAHDGEPLPVEEPPPKDLTNRPIVRLAATVAGWHYQAHSIQFEVNKLDSIYNRDDNGNNLGYAEIKVYDANGDECTTQASADIDGVKSIITWKPDFDFEIISGNIRQLVKETVDSYIYVNAKVATGLPSPYDFLKVPFVQGGINLNYIGADEPLKTDGRASKLFKAATNGDYFEIVVNYDADLLTNENRHKMSIIFEIYKDPMS